MIHELIERRADLRGGRPVLAGTGVSVHRVAGWHKLGLSPEEIAANFGHVSLAHVHAALDYYQANVEEIDGYLAAEAADVERVRGRTA